MSSQKLPQTSQQHQLQSMLAARSAGAFMPDQPQTHGMAGSMSYMQQQQQQQLQQSLRHSMGANIPHSGQQMPPPLPQQQVQQPVMSQGYQDVYRVQQQQPQQTLHARNVDMGNTANLQQQQQQLNMQRAIQLQQQQQQQQQAVSKPPATSSSGFQSQNVNDPEMLKGKVSAFSTACLVS
jgi:hypothetical protein